MYALQQKKCGVTKKQGSFTRNGSNNNFTPNLQQTFRKGQNGVKWLSRAWTLGVGSESVVQCASTVLMRDTVQRKEILPPVLMRIVKEKIEALRAVVSTSRSDSTVADHRFDRLINWGEYDTDKDAVLNAANDDAAETNLSKFMSGIFSNCAVLVDLARYTYDPKEYCIMRDSDNDYAFFKRKDEEKKQKSKIL